MIAVVRLTRKPEMSKLGEALTTAVTNASPRSGKLTLAIPRSLHPFVLTWKNRWVHPYSLGVRIPAECSIHVAAL